MAQPDALTDGLFRRVARPSLLKSECIILARDIRHIKCIVLHPRRSLCGLVRQQEEGESRVELTRDTDETEATTTSSCGDSGSVVVVVDVFIIIISRGKADSMKTWKCLWGKRNETKQERNEQRAMIK